MLVPVATALANVLHARTMLVFKASDEKDRTISHTDLTGDVDITWVWKLNGLWGAALDAISTVWLSAAMAAEGARKRDSSRAVESSRSRLVVRSVSSTITVGKESLRGVDDVLKLSFRIDSISPG
jgi:hypothetical protein